METLSLAPGVLYAPPSETDAELEFRLIARSLESFWRTSSSSGLVAGGSAEAKGDDGRHRDAGPVEEPYPPLIDGFANYWDSLAPEGSRWSDNPWVWVVDFSIVAGGA